MLKLGCAMLLWRQGVQGSAIRVSSCSTMNGLDDVRLGSNPDLGIDNDSVMTGIFFNGYVLTGCKTASENDDEHTLPPEI